MKLPFRETQRRGVQERYFALLGQVDEGEDAAAEISETVDKGVIGKHSASNPNNEPLISYGPGLSETTTVIEGGR